MVRLLLAIGGWSRAVERTDCRGEDDALPMDISEAAERARVSALEAANMANQAASVMDPDEMVAAVRRAREAANAAEAAAQAAEAAHAARSRRSSTRELAPSPQPVAVPVLPAAAMLQHPAPQLGAGPCVCLQIS
eukprot:Skav219788  [mRNA]  locus=scaffold3701:101706:105457:+ [translate_table: standard]